MATTQLSASRSIPRAANTPPSRYKPRNPLLRFTEFQRNYVRIGSGSSRVYAARDVGRGDSYLDMWKKAKERERKSLEFERMLSSTGSEVEIRGEQGGVISGDELEKKNSDFMKMLEIPVEERDRVQRMQVIDRAAAAIAAAKALLEENKEVIVDDYGGGEEIEGDQGMHNKTSRSIQSDNFSTGTPGPSFWAWTPPSDDDNGDIREVEISPSLKLSPSPLKAKPVLEKEREYNILSIPFETSMNQNQSINLSLPPLQSLVEFQSRESNSALDKTLHMDEENEINIEFLTQAAEAVDALSKSSEEFLSQGVYEDGSMWWKETGVEERPDGVVCRWTLTRGVSADKSIEWENKYWEASDELGYKELGSEKSGRDAVGNVWREYWRETMTQDQGVVSLEKTADKWGKNAHGTEWQEKWSEHYGASGTDKWAHKWCTIDPNTPLDPGHAHIWHERWGEKYDGHGGSIKYTDKWAERCEGDGWSKWGDKWDENFDPSGHGVKQGESWWQGFIYSFSLSFNTRKSIMSCTLLASGESKWQNTALLVIGMQKDFVLPTSPVRLEAGEAVVPNVVKAVEVARSKHVHIIWVVREHDPLGRDVELFRKKKYGDGQPKPVSKGTEGAQLLDELVVKEDDYKLVKTRFSAFHNTHLNTYLRAAGIHNLVIIGIQTPNCIRQTAFDAVSLDYQKVTVIVDATAAATPDIHAANILDMQKIRVETPTLEEWCSTNTTNDH